MSKPEILIVEDDANDELLMTRAFRKASLAASIVFVRDGAEALDYLFAQGDFSERRVDELPRVVFLDLNLPKVSGLDVLKQIRQNEATCTLPVVILTSSDEQEDKIRGYRLGVNSYVRKPIDTAKFASVVTELGIYWSDINESIEN